MIRNKQRIYIKRAFKNSTFINEDNEEITYLALLRKELKKTISLFMFLENGYIKEIKILNVNFQKNGLIILLMLFIQNIEKLILILHYFPFLLFLYIFVFYKSCCRYFSFS